MKTQNSVTLEKNQTLRVTLSERELAAIKAVAGTLAMDPKQALKVAAFMMLRTCFSGDLAAFRDQALDTIVDLKAGEIGTGDGLLSECIPFEGAAVMA